MKRIPLLILFTSCANLENPAPVWVDGIRSGEQRLKVTNGQQTLFRRIAGTSSQSVNRACQEAIKKAEADMLTAGMADRPYTVEVLYYDNYHKDCAVTLATRAKAPDKTGPSAAKAKVMSRTQLIEKYAITGLTRGELEGIIGQDIQFSFDHRNICQQLNTVIYSVHGLITICWNNHYIAGYCVNGVCRSK